MENLNNVSGFTFIELLVAIMIIGLMATVVIPNFQKMSPKYEREQFVGQLQALVQLAWQNALMTHHIHRIVFDFEKNIVRVEKAASEKITKETKFDPVRISWVRSSFLVPKTITIKQFIVEGFDELQRFQGRKTEESWFYIMPDGTVQSVTLNMLDARDVRGGKPKPFSLVLNPFSARFKQYEKFV